MPDSLYDKDFYAWTLEQAAKLRRLSEARSNVDLDLENLAEEVEDLGKSERRGFENLLENVIEHLLKLEYSPASEPRRVWRRDANKARNESEKYLTRTLLNKAADNLPKIYERAAEEAAFGLEQDGVLPDILPTGCPYTLGQLLDKKFFPPNRHGLP